MKLKVDQQADALHPTLTEKAANWFEEISPGIIVDYDDQDRVVGIEIPDLSSLPRGWTCGGCCSSRWRKPVEGRHTGTYHPASASTRRTRSRAAGNTTTATHTLLIWWKPAARPTEWWHT